MKRLRRLLWILPLTTVLPIAIIKAIHTVVKEYILFVFYGSEIACEDKLKRLDCKKEKVNKGINAVREIKNKLNIK